MKLPSYFNDFLADIRPTKEMRAAYIREHTLLRQRLRSFEKLKEALHTDFLQGSYRRWTLVQPPPGKLADVDIIVVTKLLPEEWEEPADVLKVFTLFTEEHYPGQYEVQGRSICVTFDELTIDIVPTAAPSEAQAGVLADLDLDSIAGFVEESGEPLRKAMRLDERRGQEWKAEPLLIPDRDVQQWQRTHPVAQIDWTQDKNAEADGHYVNVIKAAKWWRQETLAHLKRPKGYPLERAFAECFPSGAVGSVAEGLTLMFEDFVTRFEEHRLAGTTPVIPDHGLPEQDVMKRIDPSDFAELYDAVCAAATAAREALDDEEVETSATKWRGLLGDRFPEPPARTSSKKSGGYTPRTAPSSPRPKRFA